MNYKVWDKFMIRTPELPLKYLDEYRKSGKDIYCFITENIYLYEFFKRALLIASAYDCNTMITCNNKATCNCSLGCSPTDMGMCNNRAGEEQGADILRRC